jgi:hypothetical protein
MNPYLSQVAPQAMQQDAYGQAPVMDTSGRAMAQNALNTQGAQNAQAALGINKNPMSQVDPIKLGLALRKMGQPNYDQWQTAGDMSQFGANSNGMGSGEGYAGMNAEIGLK